ncbi:MAG: glycoside hydrolase family 18 protein [Candidatus Sulfotelmatobacter sp.]
MPRLRKGGYLLACTAVILCTLATAQAGTKRIVGYYYGEGLPGYQFSQVPVQELTHLIYSRASPTARGNCEVAHPDVDVPNLLALKVLRAKNARLLVLLSVGGWSGSTYFSDVAATPSARKKFSASCLEIVSKYGLDGLDIDWEYPVTGGKRTDHKRKSDKANFVLLLRQMRSDLDAFDHGRRLLLTVASTGYRNHLNDLSLREMSDVLDWFNLMGYDFNEMQSKRTSHHSGLFAWSANSKLDADAVKYANSDAAVQWYLDQGVPAEKIVLGVPFYGQTWANVPDMNDGLYEPYRGRPGEEGTLSYREIERDYLPSYTRHWDDQVKVPWLYKKETNVMISYDDSESIAVKARYVIQKNLGGMMFWDLGQDDSRSALLDAIHRELGGN